MEEDLKIKNEHHIRKYQLSVVMREEKNIHDKTY